ncbi:MAG: arsenate reductase ArsC [Rhizobiales bacterium]|nr:arsenate reductase ArsC [Hyphomicrobiales bacterium]MBN9010919.1 arsenate reductase ArsC [Hyphomicrobiales bacterium]
MPDQPYQVLFLCAGNSARSIMAEAILNAEGAGRFRASSAGSRPAGTVNPHALDLLGRMGHGAGGLRSKSWDEFAGNGAPDFDFIFTVCDEAAGEACPVIPGTAATAHWGIPDPAAVTGSPAEVAVAFEDAYRMLARRIELFLALPLEALDRAALHHHLHAIGREEGATPMAGAQQSATDRAEAR